LNDLKKLTVPKYLSGYLLINLVKSFFGADFCNHKLLHAVLAFMDGLGGFWAPVSYLLLTDLPRLPALPLRGREALHHPADLSDSSGSDPSRGAPDQAVRSVGASAGGSGGVVS